MDDTPDDEVFAEIQRHLGSVTPSTALLNQKLATSNAPRMLTPSEVTLLRQSKQEIAARYKATHK